MSFRNCSRWTRSRALRVGPGYLCLCQHRVLVQEEALLSFSAHGEKRHTARRDRKRTRERGGTRAGKSISGTCTIRQRRRPRSTFARRGGVGSKGLRGIGRTGDAVSLVAMGGGRWQAGSKEVHPRIGYRIVPRVRARIWWHRHTTQSC
jgi:hypothetical protein